MTRLAASKTREDSWDTLNRVAYGGERIVLRRRGRDLVAIVPMRDRALLEKIEDETDVREARGALARLKRVAKKAVPLAGRVRLTVSANAVNLLNQGHQLLAGRVVPVTGGRRRGDDVLPQHRHAGPHRPAGVGS